MPRKKKSTRRTATPCQDVKDDGLIYAPVGSWGEQKYKLVSMYNELFATGMKARWQTRVYIDLFAGSGKARIKGTDRIVCGSPLLALSLPDQYDKYIFCESDATNADALRRRVNNEFPSEAVSIIQGNCNEVVDDIVKLIPPHSKQNKVLSFCFVDPFSLVIKFATLKKLAEHFMDFLIVLALSMDGVRNVATYLEENNRRIDEFLGKDDWRSLWSEAEKSGMSFQLFLAEQFAGQMIGLGFKKESLSAMIEIRSSDKNLPLYHLAFFSRSDKGYEFWKKIQKYTSEPTLFD
jgi:three-Cys-motif partner protein